MSGIEKHEQEKGTFFCSVTHDLDLAEKMVTVLPDFQSWAYIKHDPDTEQGTPHVHFLVRANGTRYIKQVADKLGIESNYVQVCRKVVAFRRYMLHLDQDEKIKYKLEDVKTNSLVDFKSAIIGNKTRDILDLYKDFRRLKNGKLSSYEFIQLNWVELQKMPFYQKIKTLETINSIARLPDS